ncbi:MAG: hypothetical protein MJ197_10045 [Bacteroidales bacterium]|nr:hypothetical protein [Bacteroidales bacterium]
MGRIKKNDLYVLVDPADEYELPVFVGTLSEMAAYMNVSENAIVSAISHAKKRKQVSKYKKVIISESD